MLYIVIIAGGKGERFWPRSIRIMPKQFHRIVSDKTMIQETFGRVYPEIKRENMFFVLGKHLKTEALKQLPQIDEENLIVEPAGKNTAPAIGLAAAYISAKDPLATIAVLTADHVVKPKDVFVRALKSAAHIAEQGYIVTFGIMPDRPATEFGYIEIGKPLPDDFGLQGYNVKRFREKPSLDQAREYVERGTFFWNSGMFIFQVQTLFDSMKIHMPSLYRGLMKIRKSFGSSSEDSVKKDEFSRFESISIDYGIMEKADNIACVKAPFVWDDIGSWSALSRHNKGDGDGNIIQGKVVTIDSENNIVIGEDDSLISLIGIRDTVVVKDGNRLLICHRTQDQRVKELLSKISGESENQKYL